MIKVERKDCPDSIKISQNGAQKSKGHKETEEAIYFYGIPANQSKEFKKRKVRGSGYTKESYSAYKERDVRKELTRIFHGKCAYCETRFVAACPGDIEHFRPKGGYSLDSDLIKPGYYWLAADWENLLLACPHCNQTHTLEIFDGEGWVEKVVGKLNQFPLGDESKRLSNGSGQKYFREEYLDLYEEEEGVRLLLKPCTDYVEDYFEYSEKGIIHPKGDLEGIDLNKARTSICVYALQRSDLVKDREQKVIEINAQIERVVEHIEDLNDIEPNDKQYEKIKGRLEREMGRLKEFMKPDREFAGLARYFIVKFIQSIDDNGQETE
eukprot:TRINITY_DN179195_c0_g1_i1.p1 TRINITY_DN179195_c0_g1~~TRINITY_DN179195_c0_g1_i1.p1  ORF type:complete len:324 (-),score=42.74 TRINITY_DN179195_c0_g1_i1:116-1087(-)